MRDSNIRWGELIGGMLIIGCSIALVVSFWTQIAHHSFLQFGVFTGITAATLGLGLYAEHRWKLPTTSRGILLIATLLVPLNFLAFAALSHGARPTLLETAIEIAALVWFGFLTWRAAAVLAPYWPGLLTGGVVALSASLLVIQHVGRNRIEGAMIALAGLPIVAYASVIGLMLFRVNQWKQIRGHAVEAMYLLLGVLTFGTAAAVGLVIFQSAAPWWAAHELSPLLSLAITPALATGLLVWRRVKDRRLSGARTAGTSIAVAAAFLMLGAIGVAWPDPALMLPLCALNFVILTAIALWFEIPAAHWIALPCLIVGHVLGFHVLRGHVGWRSSAGELASVLLNGSSGTALLPLFVLVGGAGVLLRRFGKLLDARTYHRIGQAIAVLSIALVTRNGFGIHGDPYGATWVYLFYSIAALIAVMRANKTDRGWVGCLLLLASSCQFFLTHSVTAYPWSTGLLAGATLEVVAGLVALRIVRLRWVLGLSLKWTATLAAAAAAMVLIPGASINGAGDISLHILWTAALWFVIAFAEEAEPIFIAAEVALAAGAAVRVVAEVSRHAWFHLADAPLLHPWTLQAIGIVLAALPLTAMLIQMFAPPSLSISRWLRSPWSFDRGLLATLSIGLAIIICAAEFQAIGVEFATNGSRRLLDFWPAHVAGFGSWLLLGLLLITVTGWIIEKTESHAPLLWLGLAILACPLAALYRADAGAAASSLRWLLAAFGLAAASLIWIRDSAPRVLQPVLRRTLITDARALLVAFTAVPVVALSIYPSFLSLSGHHIVGPDPASFFARVGNAISYAVPLAIVAVTFLGHGIRERSPGWGFAATSTGNLAATLAYILTINATADAWDVSNTLVLVQLNVVVLTLFALGWMSFRWWIFRGQTTPPAPTLLTTQIGIALMGVAILLAPPAGWLLIAPTYTRGLSTIGSPLGWLAVISALGALAWRLRRLTAAFAAVCGAALSLMLASTAAHWDKTNWLSYHVLMASALAATGATLGVGVWVARRRHGVALHAVDGKPPFPEGDQAIRLQYQRPDPAEGAMPATDVDTRGEPIQPMYLGWTAALSAWVVLLACRAMLTDPQRPWWSTSCTLLLSVLWVGVSCWMVAPRLLYAGALLLNLAATFWWIEKPWVIGPNPLLDLVAINCVVLAAGGLAALVLHFQIFQRERQLPSVALPPFHRFAAFVCTLVILLLAACSLGSALHGSPAMGAALTTWLAAVATVALLVATLSDPDAGRAQKQLYAVGLEAVVILVEQFHVPPSRIAWTYEMALAAFALVSTIVFSARRLIGILLEPLGLPRQREEKSIAWFAWANTLLAIGVLYLAGQIDFTNQLTWLRVTAASAALIQLFALVIIARTDPTLDLRQITIFLTTWGCTMWAWSWMPLSSISPLDRMAIAFLIFTLADAVSIAASLAHPSAEALWRRATASMTPLFTALWILCGVGMIGRGVFERINTSSVQLHTGLAWVVVALFVVGAVATILLALRKNEADPFGLPVFRRSVYVYASEGLVLLALVQARLSLPWLFGGALSQYWPILIMGLAFAGVGVSELLRRRGVLVLSEPLLRSGVFMPILPVFAFFLAPSKIDYSTLLFLVGFFYAVVSTSRHSFGLGMLAAAAANGGLWALLHRQPELAFMVHPQLWLIPAAMSVLIAAQINRDHLSPPNLRFIRYACLMVVYVSSTADIFLNGVHDHPWLPMILIVLSVGGVLLGMAFRLRAFLFLGTAFLGISILTMIYSAVANLHWTWLWPVAGIALGAVIFAFFALFEKKKSEMLALVEGLKSWD
ncbi:MAG TPA: hypothetical protein VIM11_23930 [Tepidisphaeraceae bacterium]